MFRSESSYFLVSYLNSGIFCQIFLQTSSFLLPSLFAHFYVLCYCFNFNFIIHIFLRFLQLVFFTTNLRLWFEWCWLIFLAIIIHKLRTTWDMIYYHASGVSLETLTTSLNQLNKTRWSMVIIHNNKVETDSV